MVLLLAALTALHGAIAAPSGYVEVERGRGVALWRQDWPEGQPDWVLEIDLSVAKVESVVDPTGGALWRHTVPTWWNDFSATRQFAIFNAAFFSPAYNPTEPAFGLRTPVYQHAGYGTWAEYVGQQLALWLEGDRANLYGHDPANLSTGPANQIAALSPYADKSASSWVARTFVGLKDHDGAGHRTMIVFASLLATQAYARDELNRWGASQQIMLDGGGSTQLRVRGVDRISSSRGVPHVLRVIEGPPPEECNGRDDDGDGSVDEGFPDADADGIADCVDPTPDPDTDPSTVPDTDPSTDPDTDPSTDPDTDPSTDPDTDPGLDTDTSTDPDTDPGLDTDTDTDLGPGDRTDAPPRRCATAPAAALGAPWWLLALALRRRRGMARTPRAV